MILTREWHVKHLFAGQNIQQNCVESYQLWIIFRFKMELILKSLKQYSFCEEKILKNIYFWNQPLSWYKQISVL